MRGAWGGGVWRERERGGVSCRGGYVYAIIMVSVCELWVIKGVGVRSGLCVI